MEYIVDAGEAKEIDRIAIEEIGIPSMVLMERAAMAVAACIMERFPDKKKERIVVVCGSGNNAGDGAAVARLLAEEQYFVEILLVGKEEKWSEQMRRQIDIAKRLDIALGSKMDFREYTVVVDAIFGIGLKRNITGAYADCIRAINESRAAVVAVDAPSGVDAGSGAVLGIAVKADATVTFGMKKRGLVLYPGCEYAGEVLVADIGFPKKAVCAVSPKMYTFTGADIRAGMPPRAVRTNKGNYGKVLVLAGSPGMSGACFFTAKAAYRMGCGLVKILTSGDNLPILKAELPEALYGNYEEEEELEVSLGWADVIAFGPGIGRTEGAGKLLERVFSAAGAGNVKVVVDADGLNLLAAHKDWPKKLTHHFILTPHLREMSRLTGIALEEIIKKPLDTAMRYSGKFTLVQKDARTIVCGGGRDSLYLNTTGNNALAKGGTGDVLCGMIAGLLAQGLSPREAAELAVCIHGLAAEHYTEKKSRYSMLASDILEELPEILA